MKTFLRSLKRQDGFTLVELMVVVAIIGLLSAVAVPNFKKYQAKAKMSEAKLQLSAIYTAETAFFSDFNMYSQCLVYMGFDPGLEFLNRYYALGFVTAVATNAEAHAAAVNSGLLATDCPATNAASDSADASSVNDNADNFFSAGKGIGGLRANLRTFLPPSTTGDQSVAAQMIFTAGAGGVISADGVFATAGTNSALTVNNNKVFSVVRNGF